MKKIFKKFTSVLAFILALAIAFAFVGCAGAANDAALGDLAAPGGTHSPGGSGDSSYDSDAPGSEGGVVDGAGDLKPDPGSGSKDDLGAAAPDVDAPGSEGGVVDGGTDKGETAPSDGSGSEKPGDGSGSEKPGDGSGGIQQKPIVKQLTAAEWRDAYNYDFWLGLFEEDIPFKGQDGKETTMDGIFSKYATATRGLRTSNMHEVLVTSGDSPVAGAKVILHNDSNIVYSAVTDSTGRAYVFGNGTHITAESGQDKASADIAEGVTEIDLESYLACENELEIMFVVDTTGSMGDELSFLCRELEGIITRVSFALDCKIRLGLLFYRDAGDAYVTRPYDFVEIDSSNGLGTVTKNLRAQTASGGGDYPEAVEKALSQAVDADWHENSKTKLIFHVLDAPYHDQQSNQSEFANAVLGAAEKGIRIIPVAASGLDTLGQYIMRSAALLTGGTYTFLTDDSGIGAHHTLPAVGAFTVEYLSDLMVRLIKGYYTGEFEEPIHWSQSENIV